VARGCPLLQVLVLSNCEAVGDVGCRAALDHCGHLRELELSDTGVTDKSLQDLMKVGTGLKRLAVDGCAVTADQVDKLRVHRPDLELLV